MSDNQQEQNVSTGSGWIALAMLLIAFAGEPDLTDALIYFLMKG